MSHAGSRTGHAECLVNSVTNYILFNVLHGKAIHRIRQWESYRHASYFFSFLNQHVSYQRAEMETAGCSPRAPPAPGHRHSSKAGGNLLLSPLLTPGWARLRAKRVQIFCFQPHLALPTPSSRHVCRALHVDIPSAFHSFETQSHRMVKAGKDH